MTQSTLERYGPDSYYDDSAHEQNWTNRNGDGFTLTDAQRTALLGGAPSLQAPFTERLANVTETKKSDNTETPQPTDPGDYVPTKKYETDDPERVIEYSKYLADVVKYEESQREAHERVAKDNPELFVMVGSFLCERTVHPFERNREAAEQMDEKWA